MFKSISRREQRAGVQVTPRSVVQRVDTGLVQPAMATDETRSRGHRVFRGTLFLLMDVLARRNGRSLVSRNTRVCASGSSYAWRYQAKSKRRLTTSSETTNDIARRGRGYNPFGL